jgi:histidinol-phosphate aminotransferase
MTDAKKYKELQYLDRNESQYGPTPKCYDFLKTVTIDELSCYSRDFALGIKSSLSKMIADEFKLPEKQVILSYGSEDLLKQIIHYYLDRKEKILIPREAWWYYKKVAYEVGGFNVEYPMGKGVEDGVATFTYDVDKMIEIYDREKPRIVLIASPNNPTENDYVKPFLDEFPNLVICRTFSKYFGLAGLRIGYSFAGKNLEELMNYTVRYLGFNRISEKLGAIAYKDLDYYEKITKLMQEDKEYFYKEFSKLNGFTPYKSYANFMLVDMPHDVRKEMNKFLKERNLLIKFLDEEAFKTETRITLGTREQNMYLMDSIKEFLAKK